MKNQNLLALTLFATSISLFSCLSDIGSRAEINLEEKTPVLTAVLTETVPNGAVSFDAASEHSTHLKGNEEDIYLVLTTRTGIADQDAERSPLNIALVIDRSGSMEAEGKLDYVKKACETVVQNLGSNDQVSVVTYDSYVNVVSESGKVTDKDQLIRQIRGLKSGGSTNLSGGMLEGYAQTKSTLATEQVNRVLLLSDGLANQGISDPTELNKIAQTQFQEMGIGVSTFGVGLNFNEDLMTSLAENGMGNYYFIESADQIPELFAKELNGLLSVVAQNAKVDVTFPEGELIFKEAMGYAAEAKDGIVSVRFNDLFAEEEKTVVLRFAKKDINTTADFNFGCTLQFDDVQENYRRMSLESDLKVSSTSKVATYEASRDAEASQECILFQCNAMMETAMKLVDAREYDQARASADLGIGTLEKGIEKHGTNPELDKQLNSFKTYRKELEDIEQRTAQELQYFQKSNKCSNYELRKKK